MFIGEASKQSGCHIETIRYYELIGLLASTTRAANGYRYYTEHHLQELRFIHRSRELGFSLDDIRELLSLKAQPELSCSAIDSITNKHLRAVGDRITHLESLALELRAITRS